MLLSLSYQVLQALLSLVLRAKTLAVTEDLSRFSACPFRSSPPRAQCLARGLCPFPFLRVLCLEEG